MDTINETEPVGGQDVSSSQETSSVDTQPTESEEVVDDNQSEEVGQAPELLAGKYKTQEELIKAHQELEHKLGETSQKAELANLLIKQTGMSPQQIKDHLAQQEYQQKQQYYANNPLAPVLDKVQALEQRIQQQDAEKAVIGVEKEIDQFLKVNSAYEAQRDLIKELVLTPGIGYDPNTGENLASVEEIATKYFGQVRAQGQQDAYKKIDKKIMTQTTGVSKGAPKGKITLDELKQMSAAEQAAILPHAASL